MGLPGVMLAVTDADGTATPTDPTDDGVLVNDTDPENDLLTAQLIDGPQNASAFALNDDGTFTYTPQDGSVRMDSFTYQAFDGEGVSNQVTVTIILNAPPVANDDEVISEVDVPATIDVLANDVDPENMLIADSLVLESDPTHGSAVIVNGVVEYTPDAGYEGPDSFTYSVADEYGVRSNVATVAIDMVPDLFPWQNGVNMFDVNGNGRVSPVDALLVIYHLNNIGSGPLPVPPTAELTPPPYVDVSGDNEISPIDALMVISYLNTGFVPGGAEGEAAGAGSAMNAPVVVGAADGEGEADPLVVTGQFADTLLPNQAAGETAFIDGVQQRTLPADAAIATAITVGFEDRDQATPTAVKASVDPLDDLLDDIADDVASAQENDLAVDLALSELLKGDAKDQ